MQLSYEELTPYLYTSNRHSLGNAVNITTGHHFPESFTGSHFTLSQISCLDQMYLIYASVDIQSLSGS